jgi:hypothetical protein
LPLRRQVLERIGLELGESRLGVERLRIEVARVSDHDVEHAHAALGLLDLALGHGTGELAGSSRDRALLAACACSFSASSHWAPLIVLISRDEIKSRVDHYLREVLGRIVDHPINRIAELLPWSIDLASAARAAP